VTARFVLTTTGNIYIKSLLLRKGFLLKGISKLLYRSRRVRLTASNISLFIIGTSFHIIMVVLRIKRARFESLLIGYIKSRSIFRGILKREWAIIPPGRRRVAIPENAI
jgi:hypothetical protein